MESTLKKFDFANIPNLSPKYILKHKSHWHKTAMGSAHLALAVSILQAGEVDTSNLTASHS